MAVLLLFVVFVPMLVEARRAERNERMQRQRGGIEPPGDVYSLMRVAYPGAFLLMIAESFWRHGWDGRLWTAPPWPLIGLALFVAAKALKWWAIVSLGPSWTFRVVVVPGAPLVVGGPYAYLRHPNYVAVIMELLAVTLMSDARISGPLATLAFSVLIAKRLSVEERALREVQGER